MSAGLVPDRPTLLSGLALPIGLTTDDAARVGAAIDAEKAASTRRVYASAVRTYGAWLDGRGVRVESAGPEHLAAYLAERATEGASMSTLDLMCAAIRDHTRTHHLPDPTADTGVTRVRKGLRRTVGTAPRRQSHPLSTVEIARVVDHIDRSTTAGARDAAMILVGFASAMRRSELAALWTGDVAWKPDGVLLTVRKAKGDQEGRGNVVAVARGQRANTDPVTALHRWQDVRGREPGPLFTRVRRGDHVTNEPISGETVADVLVARAGRAGLDDLAVSGHSLRSGHATTAAAAGVGVDRIAAQTRHKNIETLIERYIRPVEALDTTSSRGLGL